MYLLKSLPEQLSAERLGLLARAEPACQKSAIDLYDHDISVLADIEVTADNAQAILVGR